MPLFPQAFLDELRAVADIVRVVEDTVPLKKAGANYRGLCPFHSEKTPSFNVNPDKGIFHCFGCGVGGDVFKFVSLQHKVSFPEAVRLLAERFGVPVPEVEDSRKDQEAEAEREALLKMHEIASAYFHEELRRPAGGRARQMLRDRGIASETIERLGLGFAPASRDALKQRLERQGFSRGAMLRSGLVLERDGGQLVDRFRNRLMVPICRETGAVIAFGGRAMDGDQQPKYLNSPETPIYSKGRVLYGLHLTRDAIRRLGYVVLVEGYFDFAQSIQGGIQPVVASCGTALTVQQVRVLRRYAGKIVLSFDPDLAGQNATTRSCEMLVAEGFQVNVALLPDGKDPDTFIREMGAQAYAAQLKRSQPYLEYLLAKAAAAADLTSAEGRGEFVGRMLTVAAQIPDAAVRDQFADKIAHQGRILEDVVRAEIRKAAAGRKTAAPAVMTPVSDLKPAEKGLLWALLRAPETAQQALQELDPEDLGVMRSAAIVQAAQSLRDQQGECLPATLLERLSTGEAELLAAIAAAPQPPAPATECARALKRLRYQREQTALQHEIDRLQELGASRFGREIEDLWVRKRDLLDRIEALTR